MADKTIQNIFSIVASLFLWLIGAGITFLVGGVLLFSGLNVWRSGVCDLRSDKYWVEDINKCNDRYAVTPDEPDWLNENE